MSQQHMEYEEIKRGGLNFSYGKDEGVPQYEDPFSRLESQKLSVKKPSQVWQRGAFMAASLILWLLILFCTGFMLFAVTYLRAEAYITIIACLALVTSTLYIIYANILFFRRH